MTDQSLIRPMSGTANVFLSYAHEDAELKDHLLQHLAGLVNDGLIRIWHDRDIQPGDKWSSRIGNALEISSIVLLLISPSFLASSYCYGPELKRALHRPSKGEATVIPIILRPSDWHTRDLRELQALPRDAKPITSWPNQDEGFLDVAHGLRTVIESRRPQDPAPHRRSGTPEDLRYYVYISAMSYRRRYRRKTAPSIEFGFGDPETRRHLRFQVPDTASA